MLKQSFDYKNLSDRDLTDILKKSPDSGAIKELTHRHSGIFYKTVGYQVTASSNIEGLDKEYILGGREKIIYECAKAYNPDNSKFQTFLWNKANWKTLSIIGRVKKSNKKYLNASFEGEWLKDYDDKRDASIRSGIIQSMIEKEQEHIETIAYNEKVNEEFLRTMEIIEELEDTRIAAIFKLRYGGVRPVKWKDISKKITRPDGGEYTVQTCINLHNIGMNHLKQNKNRIRPNE